VVERNITQRVTSDNMWDVRDLDVSFDGRSLVFAMRGPMIPNGDEEDQPTWNLWQYTFATDTLARVINSDLIAEEGHDVAPHYLPDGRIVFTSTRQRASKAILLDESKPQFDPLTEDRREPSFVLHVINSAGTGIRQISFSQSHDMDPTVLMNGRILFSRWDTAPGRSAIHLYTMNPAAALRRTVARHRHQWLDDPVPQDPRTAERRFVVAGAAQHRQRLRWRSVCDRCA